MASGGLMRDFCEETTCPICLDFFKDPVIIDCGHNFCQACITQCWGDSRNKLSCPQCRETVQRRNLRPNRPLANIVEIAKNFDLPMAKEAKALGKVCEQHQEPLKLFCEDDQVSICVVCDKSKEHREHKVIPKEEAFEEYKGKIQTYSELLEKDRRIMLSCQLSVSKESNILLKQTEKERQKVMAEFKQLHEFLEEQKHALLAWLNKLDNEIKNIDKEHIAKLCKETSSVDDLIKKMEEKKKQPISEFLQDIKSILQRCNKQEFVNTYSFPIELKQRIEKFSTMNSFLNTVMEKFKDAMLAGSQTKEENLTENEERTIPTLVLSTLGQTRQNFYGNSYGFSNSYQNPNQFNCWSYVMGVERINSGTYSWVVENEEEKFWAVGVAQESCRGTDAPCFLFGQHMWVVGKSNNIWYVFTSSGRHRVSCPWGSNYKQAQQIGHFNATAICVSLNYEQGSVTISDHTNNVVIYAFQNASFCGEQISSWLCVAK